MAENTTTQAGILGHALQALAHHIANHGLPEPHTVCFRSVAERVEIYLYADQTDAWVASLAVDDHKARESAARGVVNHEVLGRLPDTGVRVELSWSTIGVPVRAVS